MWTDNLLGLHIAPAIGRSLLLPLPGGPEPVDLRSSVYTTIVLLAIAGTSTEEPDYVV